MKRIIFLLVILTGAITAGAITATEAFTSAPASIFPLLDKSTRLDMVDYYNSGSSTPSKNKLSGKARVYAISSHDLRFTASNASTCQVAVLDYGDSEIIVLIETVATPAPDSNISFYTSDWQKLDKKCFETPQLKQWLTDAGRDNVDLVEMLMPFMLVGYEYDAESKLLTLTNNVKEFLSEDIYEQIAPYLRDKLVYRWTGKRMELVK